MRRAGIIQDDPNFRFIKPSETEVAFTEGIHETADLRIKFLLL